MGKLNILYSSTFCSAWVVCASLFNMPARQTRITCLGQTCCRCGQTTFAQPDLSGWTHRLKHVILHGQLPGPSEISRWDVPFETGNLFRLFMPASPSVHCFVQSCQQSYFTDDGYDVFICNPAAASHTLIIYNQRAGHGCRSLASCMMLVLFKNVVQQSMPNRFLEDSPTAVCAPCSLDRVERIVQ
eukprot:s2710_g5.t1